MLISKNVDLSNLVEWTAEANPSSLSEDKLAIMINGGINRLSIGIQSFDNNSLKIIDGSVVDFKKELIGNSFVINNPQASSSCGCGLSFSV